MYQPSDDRAAYAKAYSVASRAFSVALSMVVPGLAGYFLDQRLETQGVLTALGFALGVSFGVWQFWRMSRAVTADQTSDDEASHRE